MVTTEAQARLVQDELVAALEAVAEHERLRQRLARAREAEEAARGAAARAREELATEEADVRSLESYSPARIWASLRGSREVDLEREKAEQQAAEYAVARAEAWLSSAHGEAERVGAELAALGDVAGRRDRALAAKEAWLRSVGGETGAELSRFAEQLASTRSALTEVREAAVAAELAAGRLDAARHKLRSAGDWATYDTFLGGGMFGDMMKYERMDEAQRLLHDADQALRHLSVELADVGMNAVVHGLAVDGLTQTFDVWFDNVFSDWSVRSRIADAVRGADSAAGVVHQVRTRLAHQLHELSAREAALVAERERLLGADLDAGGTTG